MSRFLDPLKVVLLTPAAAEYRGHWALKAKLRYQSDLLGRVVTVPRGFVTDMESCPRLPVVFLAFGEVSKMAAVIHDYLYTHPTTCTRAEADAVLREACRVGGFGVAGLGYLGRGAHRRRGKFRRAAKVMDNCLTYALRTWRFGRASDHLVIRKSHWGWFPHFAVIFELADGSLVKKEYVPLKPRPRWIPPLFFKGVEKTTVYSRHEVHDARQGD